MLHCKTTTPSTKHETLTTVRNIAVFSFEKSACMAERLVPQVLGGGRGRVTAEVVLSFGALLGVQHICVPCVGPWDTCLAGYATVLSTRVAKTPSVP